MLAKTVLGCQIAKLLQPQNDSSVKYVGNVHNPQATGATFERLHVSIQTKFNEACTSNVSITIRKLCSLGTFGPISTK